MATDINSEVLSLRPMTADFFSRPTDVVAKDLLGHRIVRKVRTTPTEFFSG